MPKIDDQPEDPFENLVLDEDFVRAAEHKEGSARARMLASRWKKSPPKDTSWRAPVVPVTSAAPSRRGRLRRVLRRWQAPVFVLLAVALVVVSVNAKAIHDWAFGGTPGTTDVAAAPATSVPTTAAPSTAAPLTASPTAAPPTPYADQQPDLQHPFAGSPADKWPSGAAGIALPTARPIGIFSASSVARKEQLVKDYLTAAYLDPATIKGGYPQGALDLLDSQTLGWMQKLVDHPSAKGDALFYVSRFDPKLAVPVNDVRVQGTVSLSDDGQNGLRVRADFAFVYASHPGGLSEVERTIARRILTFRFFDPNRYVAVAPGKVFIEKSDGYTGDQLCGYTRGYLVPYFQTVAPTDSTSATAAPSGTPMDPYDLSKLPDLKGDCNQDTRS